MTSSTRARSLTDPVSSIGTDEPVIAFMGPTGVGKSTFINVAAGESMASAGNQLKSCTSEIQAIRCYNPETGKSVVLVDTPGFDDTKKSDQEILRKLADWLKRTYQGHVLLTGIVYLHRITDNRMAGSPLKNLHMFAKLCGDSAINRVVLATTMWSSRTPPEVGRKREAQLRDRYWKPMLDLGSSMERFDNDYHSAWKVVNVVLTKPPVPCLGPVLLQEELVKIKLPLSETAAGMAVYDTLQKLLAQQKETLKRLQDSAREQDNPEAVADLEAKYKEVDLQLRRTFEEAKRLKIPVSRRIMALFRIRRPKGRALDVVADGHT